MKRPYPFPDIPGLEPTVSELLDDSVMQTLLAYDDLTIKDVKDVILKWQLNNPRHGQTHRMAA